MEWEKWLKNCQESVDIQAFYSQLEAIGVQYGKQFQTLRTLQINDNELIAELEGDEGPALLDGCFHSIFSLLKAEYGSFLPFSVDQLVSFSKLEKAIRIHGKLLHATEQDLLADIDIFSYEGKPLMRIAGLHGRRIDPSRLQQMLAKQLGLGIASWLYQTCWIPQPLEKNTEDTIQNSEFRIQNSEFWLVVSNREENMEGLSTKKIRPEEVANEMVNDQPFGVLWFVTEEHSLQDVLSFVQALIPLPTKPVVYFITRGIQPVGPIADLENAPFNGFYKTLILEIPDLICRHIDLGPSEQFPIEELLIDDQEGQVAYREGIRYVARLMPARNVKRSGKKLMIPIAPSFQLDISPKGAFTNLYLRPQDEMRRAGPREIVVEVKAAGLNFRDVMDARGFQVGHPAPLGGECAGVVTSVGSDVTYFKPGDAVVGFGLGTFASYVAGPSRLFSHMPEKLNFIEAAGIPIVFSTAFCALIELAKLKPGEKVLIHAAAGGVGLAAVQIAQQLGAEIFVTASSKEKHEYLRSLGITHLYNSRTLNYADEILIDTKEEV